MNIKLKVTTAIIVAICLVCNVACIQEDFFGLSPYGNIKTIELTNQASAAVINNDSFKISVPFPPGVDVSVIEIRSMTLSSFATSDMSVGDTMNLNETVFIEVKAEDGKVTIWSLSAEVAGSEPQLPNSDFELWYMANGGYFEPGESAGNTIWGTGNPGTNILNIITVTPYELTSDNKAVRMETFYNGSIPAAFGTPISAGSIFVGKFNSDNIDPNDPEAAIDFGSPFSGRPDQFKLKYNYNPGAENKDKNEDPLPYDDQCDIYMLLEVRSGGNVQRLGTAWFRSGDKTTESATVEVQMYYGPLDDTFPDYMKPVNNSYVSADSAQFVLPTHITFVAASSFDGANFAGAVGSILYIDDLELIYE